MIELENKGIAFYHVTIRLKVLDEHAYSFFGKDSMLIIHEDVNVGE
jgi:hypothetical protein